MFALSDTPALRRKVRSSLQLLGPLSSQSSYTLLPCPRSVSGGNHRVHPRMSRHHSPFHPSPFTLIASPNARHLLKSRTLPVCGGGTPLDGTGGRSIDRALDLLPPYPASLSQRYSLQSVVVPYFCLDPIFLTQLLRLHHSPIPLSICTPSNSKSSPLLSHRAGVACEPVPELCGLA